MVYAKSSDDVKIDSCLKLPELKTCQRTCRATAKHEPVAHWPINLHVGDKSQSTKLGYTRRAQNTQELTYLNPRLETEIMSTGRPKGPS
jgi:hypothetical protein